MNERTKLVLLGTGTPNCCPDASGPSVAVVVDDRSYLVDFGPGVVRQAAKAYRMGINGLEVKKLCRAFCTHLHSDHTLGYGDLILSPWVLEREEPLQVYGPKGLKAMTDHLLAAYSIDMDFRKTGHEQANSSGCQVQVTEMEAGIVYQDELVTVEAFPVSHGTLESYGYKFSTPDKVIVISGDTCPLEIMSEKAKGCDILLHEVYYAGGLAQREPHWQVYHRSVHSSSYALAEIAAKAQPKKLVTYHRIYHMNIQDNSPDIAERIKAREDKILEEIQSRYSGAVYMGHDMDVY